MASFKTTIYQNKRSHLVYVYHTGKTLNDVCLAGDLMSVKDKLTERQTQRIQAKVNKKAAENQP